MNNTLGWLHFSDLHFLDRHAWRDSQSLKKLLEDLDGLLKKGLRVDLVLCTGDIGFGKTKDEPLEDQYADAKAFFDKVLETCKLGSNRLFLVPGNHDIDRSKVFESQTEWFRSIACNPDQINQKFRDGHDEIKRAMERLTAYRKFVADHFPHIKIDDNCTFGASISLNGKTLTLTGLNSAWTCADHGDKNQIWLAGEAQLHASGKPIEAALAGAQPHLRIAMLHHPQDWLNPTEAQGLRGRLQQEFDFLLHGHAHDQWVQEVTIPQHVVIAAGATTAESAEEFGYKPGSTRPRQGRSAFAPL